MATDQTLYKSKPCAAERFVYVWEAPVRISHWINFLAIIVLTITGLNIHSPFLFTHDPNSYIMGSVRYVHYLVGIVFAFSMILRVYWFFVGNRYSTWRSIPNPFKKADRDLLVDYILYYSLIRRKPPATLTHNPLAMYAYLAIWVLFIFQVLSGFALWAQADPNSTLYAMTGWLFAIAEPQWLRWWHHMVMYFTWTFFIIHLYAAVLDDFRSQDGQISSIFTGWKPE